MNQNATHNSVAPESKPAHSASPYSSPGIVRKLPVGAEILPGRGAHFRVWAPHSRRVQVLPDAPAGQPPLSPVDLEPEPGGYFAGILPGAHPGLRYRFQLDSGSFPDPASRCQPDGPHGPSQIVDPSAFPWTDAGWGGVPREGHVVYELHIGTFTPEGTWRSATDQLPELAQLGITLLEVMPVAEFPGRFGWGYDGVNLFAPTRLYGQPDDFRAFVNRAHELGLGVILDVVYNHFGPDGNYLKQFSPDYFTDRYENEWGEAINFDGENSRHVREFIVANAGYWIDEFHLDGLRLDAVQQIFDASPDHILAAIVRKVREAAGGRGTFVVAENERQQPRLARSPDQGGFDMDGLWNDDFHHSAVVALTGRREAYFGDYRGRPQEFISSAKWGYLYQGQWYAWQQKHRGAPAFGVLPVRFVNFLQNHDQVANSLRGARLHEISDPALYRAFTALLLLGPGTPMLFQGQEFAASAPFLFFADHHPDLAQKIAEGRHKFLDQFRSINACKPELPLAKPEDERSFLQCKLDFSEREKHAAHYRLHRDLLKLREDPVLRQPRPGGVDGAVLDENCFVLRFFGPNRDDRLLLISLGPDLRLDPSPEPLLAPVEGRAWKTRWSSEYPRYGGSGIEPPEDSEPWRVPGHAAVLLFPADRT